MTPIHLADLAPLAAAALDEGVLGYYDGGAGDEHTLRDNDAAWARHRLLPRVLVDVGTVSTATTVLGTPVALPVLVAPTALQRMAHADGEAATARAAAAAGTVMTQSTLATMTPGELAHAAPDGTRWFQVYALRDRGVSDALIEEALRCGVRALVLTVDAPRAGRRERDLRTGFTVPPHIDMPAVQAALGHTRDITIAQFFSLVDPSLTWAELARLAAEVDVPVLVKGIHHPADARLALEHGAAGIVVSNHGGRQLDTVPATADLLDAVVQEVAGEAEVLVDGGVRRGTDVLAALALGAQAVLLGRPVLWGLAWRGQEGVAWVLETLRAEVELALALLGAPSPAAVTRAHLAGR